jgi:cyclin B
MVPESLYITVQIIDRYLELKQVRRSKLQLVGVAALLVNP